MRHPFLTTFSLLSVLGGCESMLGGATRMKCSEDQTPHVAIATLRQSHPDAQIDWIEGIFSNGPPRFCLHYHEGHTQKIEAEYQYSDHGNLSSLHMYPDDVRDSFKRLYPSAVVDRIEYFDDLATQVRFFRLHFHTGSGPLDEVCFDPTGGVYHSSAPER